MQAADPCVEISYATLGLHEGEATSFLARPLLDPVTGAIIGHRNSKSLALSWRNLMPLLSHLHESLLSPTFAGSDRWGYWLMGRLALLWLADSFWVLVLTLPARKKDFCARACRVNPKNPGGHAGCAA